jgi:exodeoxyribonuclease X
MSKKIPTIRVIDFETGAAATEVCNGAIEIGVIDIVAKTFDLLGAPVTWSIDQASAWRSFISIKQPIQPDYAAIHQIEDADLVGAPTWEGAITLLSMTENPFEDREVVAFAAHGADTEKGLLGEMATGIEWIDSYKVAVRLWPDCPSHSNQCLRHFLRVPGIPREDLLPAHRALPDSRVTALTLLAALNGHALNEPNTVERMIEWSNQPALLPRCKIGEWRGADKRGTVWRNVDAGFLHWILSKDFDADTVFTVRHELARREADQREERELAELNSQLRANGMTESQSFGTDKPQQNPFTGGQAGLPL